MKIALFLGAGSSVPYDKPTTEQMKQRLVNYDPSNLTEEILESFVSHPKFSDIEYVLQSIRQIVRFAKGEGGLYFFEKGKNGIFNFRHGQLPFESFTKNVENIEKILEDKIFQNYRWNRDYNKELVEIYEKIFEVLSILTEEIHIFTTNYDRAIEQFCHLQDNNYLCVDGFERDPPNSEYARWTGNFVKNKADARHSIFLYKLHGSLNWKEHVDEGLVKTNEESKPDDDNFKRNIIIYPTLSPKEEEDEEPHKTLIQKFIDFMNTADVCIVIGYSFRDNLNEQLREFVRRGGTLIAISPTVVVEYRKHVLKLNPTPDQENDWKKLTITNSGLAIAKGKKDKVHLIQKEVDSKTIKEIIPDVLRILKPYEHPF